MSIDCIHIETTSRVSKHRSRLIYACFAYLKKRGILLCQSTTWYNNQRARKDKETTIVIARRHTHTYTSALNSLPASATFFADSALELDRCIIITTLVPRQTWAARDRLSLIRDVIPRGISIQVIRDVYTIAAD